MIQPVTLARKNHTNQLVISHGSEDLATQVVAEVASMLFYTWLDLRQRHSIQHVRHETNTRNG